MAFSSLTAQPWKEWAMWGGMIAVLPTPALPTYFMETKTIPKVIPLWQAGNHQGSQGTIERFSIARQSEHYEGK